MALDLVTAVRRQLALETSVTSLLGSDSTYSTWIFRWRPYVSVEGTESAAVVLAQRGGWTAPNQHNTMEFPRLQVEIFVDPPRDGAGHPQHATAAEEGAYTIWRALDAVLHRPQGGAIEWGDHNGKLRVLGSHRLGELDVVDVPEGDGMVRGLVSYGVNLG